jgi:hypothetical protein
MGKKRGRGPTHINPQKVFETAFCFDLSAKLLWQYVAQKIMNPPQGEWGLPTAVAAMVTEALSLELYFKCLWALDNDNRRLEGHLLYNQLFVKLSPARQSEIEKYYNEVIEGDPNVKAAKAGGRYPERTFALVEALKEADRNFIALRYHYEFPEDRSSPHGIQPTIHAVRRILLEIKPEWSRILQTHQI